MKKLLQITAILLTASLLHGCFIQSLHPFYTKDTLIDSPTIDGKWALVKKGDKDIAKKYPEPWLFEGSNSLVTTFDEDNDTSVLEMRYFKLDNILFADVTTSIFTVENTLWKEHTIGVHTVWKIKLTGNSLSFIPLNEDWVMYMLEEAKLSYLAILSTDDTVFTSSSHDLIQFLKKYKNNTKAFPAENAYHFKKVKK